VFVRALLVERAFKLSSNQVGEHYESIYRTGTGNARRRRHATAVNGLHAQGNTPGAYAIVDISKINNPDLYKTLLPKAGPAMAAFGGKFIIRTDKITNLDGTPPARFVVIAFDSVDKAKAWNASAAQQEVNAIRMQTTTSRVFIVESMTE
jgi:uncharacterized protein (DUF1330 family)